MFLLKSDQNQKWLKTRTCNFFGEFENEKKKGQKKFYLPEWGFNPKLNFEFSCEVRSLRSNQNKILKEIGLYLHAIAFSKGIKFIL